MFSIQDNSGKWVVDSLPLDRVYGDAFTTHPYGARIAELEALIKLMESENAV